MSGLEFLRILKESDPSPSVILMTAYEDLPTVAAAMRDGAVEILIKPLDLIQLRGTLQRVLDDLESAKGRRRRGREIADRAGVARAGAEAGDEARNNGRNEEGAQPLLIGRDPSMIEVFKLVGQVAATNSTVLIRGESGTGKELSPDGRRLLYTSGQNRGEYWMMSGFEPGEPRSTGSENR